MEWDEKIKKGMKLIGAGCSEEGGFATCRMSKCPFGDYCWAIQREKAEYDNVLIMEPWYWDQI